MLNVALDEEDWDQSVDWNVLAAQAVAAAFAVSPYGELTSLDADVEISVSLSGNDRVQQLNRDYRQKDKPTNVLSFPMVQPDLLPGLANTDDGEILIGDMILARDVCVSEALEKGISLSDHVSHLIVHGTLHLLGYDHVDQHEGDVMEELEAKALASIGLANPYDD